MKRKIYVETSIFSYLTARSSRDLIATTRQQITRQWWEQRSKDFDIFISEIVIDEAKQGDPEASQKRLDALDNMPILATAPEAVDLAHSLVQTVFPQKHSKMRCI